jgi:outer membrane protein OmpA-like peptidoglycan-associated protein
MAEIYLRGRTMSKAYVTASLLTVLFVAHSAALAQTTAPAKTTTQDVICAMTDTCAGASASAEADAAAGVEDEEIKLRMFSLQDQSKAKASAPASQPAAKPKTATSAPVKAKVAARPSTAKRAIAIKVNFDKGSAVISPDSHEELNTFAAAMKSPELQDKTFWVDGHTDMSGARKTNKQLSQKRAQAVSEYLVSAGVLPERLKSRGFGPDQPLAGMSRYAAQNRRVELVLAK